MAQLFFGNILNNNKNAIKKIKKINEAIPAVAVAVGVYFFEC